MILEGWRGMGRIWTRTSVCSTLILYSCGSDALRVFRLPIEVCMYAIVETGGKQYRVAPGDVFRVEKLAGDVGPENELPVTAAFPEGGDIVTAGNITATIVASGRGDKIIVFKFK